MIYDFASKKCVACEGGVPPIPQNQAEEYVKETPGWELAEDDKKLKRGFKFKDFKEAMEFVNKVAEVANEEDHHPDIYIFYNEVNLELSTHAIGGLSENDFIMAAKINEIHEA